MSTMTYEELVEVFGEDVAKKMYEQTNAGQGGGTRIPFKRITKIATVDSELGGFGEFILGAEFEKSESGERAVKDKGVNLGKSFDFIVTNVLYQMKRWVAEKKRTEYSTITDRSTNFDTLVSLSTNQPIGGKEQRKEAGWKMVRICSGLVRKDKKSPWTPAVFEMDGKLGATWIDLLNKLPSEAKQGLMTGVFNIVFKLAKNGATTFSVVDIDKTTFTPISLGELVADPEVKGYIKDITLQMADYMDQINQKAKAGPVSSITAASAAVADESIDENW